MQTVMLDAEWERLYLLGITALAARQGKQIDEQILQNLESVQRCVTTLRGSEPWQALVDSYGLQVLDQDIVACILAPEVEPRIGWLFKELQIGSNSPYPSPALIHELLALPSNEGAQLEASLQKSAPLLRYKLIKRSRADLYEPLRSTPALRSSLLDCVVEDEEITGATKVHPLGSLDDLVLPRSQMVRIREILLWEAHREKLVNDWGARVSGGPVVLFAGASGTGKSFAAEGLARALGKSLYRVDLGLLVSKYIGETEKNLNHLFDAAAATNVVLLFDEADSLFGKRGEVRDARDRYANMEVGHLLSRVERHTGVCILTTNLRNNLDTAFIRRFHFVIDFPKPPVSARRGLWARHIPPGLPCSEDVDITRISEEVVLTGGQIRNAALHAAFLAAGDGDLLKNQHLASAVWSELNKHGKDIQKARLGALRTFLPMEE